ncbi:MAG TPA: MBL fold metallo-hydrolase, partial [Iamia sp.]|nr:MBL fold metallo-hydrolase [Iamia sp.]
TMLPADEGDAIWVEWGTTERHRMIIDMGRSGRATRARLEALAPEDRHVELVVVTHVDADHIGGVLAGLVEGAPIEGLTFGDIWFNGRAHLDGRSVSRDPSKEHLGPAQGDRLSRWLVRRTWNDGFERGPVVRTDRAPVRVLADGMRVTVIGPTTERLKGFTATWDVEMAKVEKRRAAKATAAGVERLGRRTPPPRPTLPDCAALKGHAARTSTPDGSLANGSSICIVIEWGSRRVLLTGDAWGDEIASGMAAYAAQQDPPLSLPVPVDLVKVPHHGSEGNVSDGWLTSVDAPCWAISTNGTKHYHPDARAITRILRCNPSAHLVFNEPSTYNGWWTEHSWRTRFGYEVSCGASNGITVRLPADSSEREVVVI